jgi:hypothetical protein
MDREEIGQAVVMLTQLAEAQMVGRPLTIPVNATIEIRWFAEQGIGRIAYHAPNFGQQKWLNTFAEVEAECRPYRIVAD